MQNLDFLNSRRSVPSRLLSAPGPDQAQLQLMLAAAIRVPDHGALTPWRFLQITGGARGQFSTLLLERHRQLQPGAPQALIDKEAQRFSHAPLVITVIAKPITDHKVPVQEQLLSGGAVCFALLQTAQAMGFAAQWLTSWVAYDSVMRQHLGVTADESILGFIHIGSASDTVRERPRPDPNVLLTTWTA